MNLENIDLLIGGAGTVGCVAAERAATQLGWRCLVVERRGNIGGNCYDYLDENGLLVHKYGPHYFQTNDLEVVKYLSKFTAWIPAEYSRAISYNNRLYSFPLNLQTLREFYHQPTLSVDDARLLLDSVKEHYPEPKNFEEYALSVVGRELYEAFFFGITLKQWGDHPLELPPDIWGDLETGIFEKLQGAKFSLMPADGYSKMFEKMLDNPLISVELNTDFREIKSMVNPSKATLYTGPIDEYFNNMHGKLAWRSLEFKSDIFDTEFKQPCTEIIYPEQEEYIRSVESKHVTRQKHPKTAVIYEYPKSYGEPFYPVRTAESIALYEQYRVLAKHETFINNVYFAGRQAEYSSISTDNSLTRGLEIFEEMRNNLK
ncbi:MAG TPA: UDP-galactopyranose mutase [Bacteroidia bacterium]|nr:UDP-galactopyranose mutase [Bacteroidia bacterium]